MPFATVAYPRIDPDAIRLGAFHVRWYGVAYLLGFALAFAALRLMSRKGILRLPADAVGDLVSWLAMGVVLGGRTGWWLFYHRSQGAIEPWYEPIAIWHGGMSFHGGLVGVLVAGYWWSRRHKLHFFDTVDFVAPLVPLGLGLGRLGNFINGELWGKPGSVPWAMIFPNAHDEDAALAANDPHLTQLMQQFGGLPRHPSQLYELALEGVVMFSVLWLVSMKPRPRYLISGLFALMYGCFRFAVEFVRVPDAQLGYLAWGWLTMGQIQSLPLIAVGLILLWMSRKAPTLPLATAESSKTA